MFQEDTLKFYVSTLTYSNKKFVHCDCHCSWTALYYNHRCKNYLIGFCSFVTKHRRAKSFRLNEVLDANILNSQKPSNMHSFFKIKYENLSNTRNENFHRAMQKEKSLSNVATCLNYGILVIDMSLHKKKKILELRRVVYVHSPGPVYL